MASSQGYLHALHHTVELLRGEVLMAGELEQSSAHLIHLWVASLRLNRVMASPEWHGLNPQLNEPLGDCSAVLHLNREGERRNTRGKFAENRAGNSVQSIRQILKIAAAAADNLRIVKACEYS